MLVVRVPQKVTDIVTATLDIMNIGQGRVNELREVIGSSIPLLGDGRSLLDDAMMYLIIFKINIGTNF